NESESLLGEEAIDHAVDADASQRVDPGVAQDLEAGRKRSIVGRRRRWRRVPQGLEALRERGVLRREADELLQVRDRIRLLPELLGDVGGQAQGLDEATLATARERLLDLRERRAGATEGELEPRQLEADEGLRALELAERLGECTGGGVMIVGDLGVQAAE